MEIHKCLFLLRIFAKNNYALWILFVLSMPIVNDWIKVKSKKIKYKSKKVNIVCNLFTFF